MTRDKIAAQWTQRRDGIVALVWAVIGAVVVASLLLGAFSLTRLDSLNHTTARLSTANSALVSELHTAIGELHTTQIKSGEQTKAEVQLRSDVSELTSTVTAQTKLLGVAHGANTHFFELLRELLVDSNNYEQVRGHTSAANAARVRDLRALEGVEVALAKFRFPNVKGSL